MTAVHPAAVGQDHLVAWIAGYLAAAETVERNAWQAGYRAALEAVAVNVAELDIVGGARDRAVQREAAARIRRRRTEIEERAQRRYADEGRQEFRGGTVAWDCGEAA